MPTATEFTKNVQDQTLEAIRQSQEAVVDAVQAWAKAVADITPATPAVPFADQLPSAEAAIDNAFSFAEQLLVTQREFAHKVLDASAPVLRKQTPAKVSKP